MDAVQSFIDDAVANSENFRCRANPGTPDSCDIVVSGYYHFTLPLSKPAYEFARGEGCAATSRAIRQIIAEANSGGRSLSQEQDAASVIRSALVSLRDAYLAHADALDDEAASEDAAAGGDDDDRNDIAAEHERESEALRQQVARRQQDELASLTPEERERRVVVDAYIAALKASSSTGDLTPTATLRILGDLARMKASEHSSRGWTCEPLRGSLKSWVVTITGFDKGTVLDDDMELYARRYNTHKALCLELIMDREYPWRPPFVRVLRPQFQFRTGHVTMGGSVCMMPLTDEGWNCSFEIESIIEMVRANICDPSSNARINLDAAGDYNIDEARAGFQRLVATHGWKHRF